MTPVFRSNFIIPFGLDPAQQKLLYCHANGELNLQLEARSLLRFQQTHEHKFFNSDHCLMFFDAFPPSRVTVFTLNYVVLINKGSINGND